MTGQRVDEIGLRGHLVPEDGRTLRLVLGRIPVRRAYVQTLAGAAGVRRRFSVGRVFTAVRSSNRLNSLQGPVAHLSIALTRDAAGDMNQPLRSHMERPPYRACGQ